jgi:hypothetical protein
MVARERVLNLMSIKIGRIARYKGDRPFYLARSSFISVLKKMDSTNSPQEYRTFEIDKIDTKYLLSK